MIVSYKNSSVKMEAIQFTDPDNPPYPVIVDHGEYILHNKDAGYTGASPNGDCVYPSCWILRYFG